MRADSRDQDCRYLFIRDEDDGSFCKRLGDLGVELPNGISPVSLVDLGLVRPAMRIRLPEQLFLEWADFPILRGEFSAEVQWAAELWWWSAAPRPAWGERGNPPVRKWWIHPLDRPDDDFGRVLRANLLPPDATIEESTVLTPQGREVRAVVDLVPYWEAYRVAELLVDLPLLPPFPAIPGAEAQAERVVRDLASWRNYADSKVANFQRCWDGLAEVFEWLSRYRTLRAAALAHGIHGDDYKIAARELVAGQGLNLDGVKADIRDRLLVQWQTWHWWREESLPRSAFAHLQEDIAIALEFLEQLSGERVDAFEEFWDPPDPNPRRWARLRHAVPYEEWRCQELTWQVGPAYLKSFNRIVPSSMVLEKESLRQAVRRWWRSSIPFRRFCVAFARLHEEIGHSRDSNDLVGLRFSIPVEYLRLCAMEAERFLLSLLPPCEKVPDFNKLIKLAFPVLCMSLGLPAPEAQKSQLAQGIVQRTKLHDLPSTRTLPFESLASIGHGETPRLLASSLFNLAVLRNYSAHHDCLDEEIVHDGLAMPAIESMLTLFAIGLGPSSTAGP